jgi:hypothetical protein
VPHAQAQIRPGATLADNARGVSRTLPAEFYDPAFEKEMEAIARIEEIAWESYKEDRKSPRTAKAGPGFADPNSSFPWNGARRGSPGGRRSQAEGSGHAFTCPRRVRIFAERRYLPGRDLEDLSPRQACRGGAARRGIESDFLDLSRLTSDYARRIYPCKACVSTAQPLCHWPCSCYPNHAFEQTGRLDGEIYERWVRRTASSSPRR